MIHPKMTPERIKETLVVCYSYPGNRFHASHFGWLAEAWNIHRQSVMWQPKVNGHIACTKNQILEFCLEHDSAKWATEFVFIDPDIIYTRDSVQFWDSEADVVCCEAEMRCEGAWDGELAFHDSFWRVKRRVLEAMQPPYFRFQYNGKGTREMYCICRSFSDAARKLGFSVERAGKCGHEQQQSWTTNGCMFD